MDKIERRTLDLAWYMIENQATVRDLARVFSMSKSTVHNYLTTKLPDISGPMAQAVRDVLAFNWKERSIRGGNINDKIKVTKKGKIKITKNGYFFDTQIII